MDNREFVSKLVKNAAIAAVYLVLTVIAPSYGAVQFRLSEVMLMLILVNTTYAPGLIVGCMIANLFSPMGIVDVIVGTFATAISIYFMSKTKNQLLATLWPSLFNGLIVGAELYFVLKFPFWASAISVAIGEFVVVTCVGLPIFKAIMINKRIAEILS